MCVCVRACVCMCMCVACVRVLHVCVCCMCECVRAGVCVCVIVCKHLTHSPLFQQYLNPASLKDPSIHDLEDYHVLEHSMNKIGLSSTEKADLYRVTAAVLHLGNICFEENTKDKKGSLFSLICVCVYLTTSDSVLLNRSIIMFQTPLDGT